MKNSAYGISLVISLLFATTWAAETTRYTITSINQSQAIINYFITRDSGSVDPLFALPSQPGTAISITVSKTTDNSLAITRQSNGWFGSQFLQWYSATCLSSAQSSSSNRSYTGTIIVTFDRPILTTHSLQLPHTSRNPVIPLPVKLPKATRTGEIKPPMPFTHGIRMEIPADGIYEISGSRLQKLGVPITTIPTRRYRLFCKDQEIPLYFPDIQHAYLRPDDVIQFYGRFLRGTAHYFTQFSYDNIYWLTWEEGPAGARVAEANGALKVDPYGYNPDISLNARLFTDTVHLEVDLEIRWAGDIYTIEETSNMPVADENIDNWYWWIVGQRYLTPVDFTLLSPIKNSTCSITFKLTGLSSMASVRDDHRYAVSVNNNSTNTALVWDGQTDYELTVPGIASDFLKHGKNTLTFIRTQPDSIPDRAALNWFEIIYTRGYESLDNRIEFRNSDKDLNKWVQFNLTKFKSAFLELWDITRYRKFKNMVIENKDDTYSLLFQDTILGATRYYAQATSLRSTPQSIVLDTIRDNWEFPAGVDYIMITSTFLKPALQPLADYYTGKGMQVAILDIQDIYNRFSYGIRDPESIRTMLQYVFAQHHAHPPRYLLLGGDATHDMDKNKKGENVVPTHLTRIPNWGPAADDGYFVTINGDDNFTDMYVGRFPARTLEEMTTLVQKTIRYLTAPEQGFWRDNIVLAGGYETDFTAFNNDIVANVIGPRMNVLRMDADPSSPFYISGSQASDKMAGFINAGAYAVNFTGHGGGNTWSDSKFFSYNDLSKLHNSQWGISGRLPVIFSFTCLTGFFESTLYKSLGEEFLRESANGCIAFYSASGYTKKNIDTRMARTLLHNALHNTYESLGALIQTNEMLMLAFNASEALPLVREYNLLGDPALPWRLTPDTLSPALNSNNLKGSDTLAVSATTAPIVNGNARITVSAENNIPWSDIITPVTGGLVNHTFTLKPFSQTARGLVRAYVWNDSSAVMGWACFSKDTFSLFDVAIDPPEPAWGDSVSISCLVSSNDSLYIPGLQCMYTIDNPQSQSIRFDNNAFVFLTRDSLSGRWKSAKKIPVAPPDSLVDIAQYLVLQFRATGKLGASSHYFFKIHGLPDLLFTHDTLSILWQNDSLYVSFEILNNGNASAAPFTIRITSGFDTIYSGQTQALLAPGKTVRSTIALPDTQGQLMYTVTINHDRAIDEITFKNNSTLCIGSIQYIDMRTPFDTLYSVGRGCALCPATTLSATHRVFLFAEDINETQPLLSSSQWLEIFGDGLKKITTHARPALSNADSLTWIFHPVLPNSFNSLSSDSVSRPGFFLYDTFAHQWLSKRGTPHIPDNTISLTSSTSGPYALGRFYDNTPPEIRVFVAGKEISFLDYAARNKPFTIFLTDSSGIASSSVQLLLNSIPLSTEAKSSLVTGGNPTTAIITAYPQKTNTIDSLTVIAEDNAGNLSRKAFLYRPGEKLSIGFFSCHPNPFTAKPGKLIRFPFLLTDIASSVTLTIYTISGRKVWSYKSSSELIGYQEIAWDGTTQNMRNLNSGYRIANGTYYAKLVAKSKGRSVQKIIRIAKLEGY